VPLSVVDYSAGVDELRLIVRALADIREALRVSEWSSAPARLDTESLARPNRAEHDW
jgi:hypothetical protein